MRGTEALAAHPQEISYHEWWRLWSYVSALSISDVEGHSLWLVVNDGKRTWHYETPFMHFELFGGDVPGCPDFALPVSPRVADFGTELATGSDDAVLSCVDAASLMVKTPRGSIVFDLPTDTPLEWWDGKVAACTAVVNAQSLRDVLHCARTVPHGFRVSDYGPPIWCIIENNEVKFHADWTRYGFGRSTATLPARTQGVAQFHSSISYAMMVLNCLDSSDDPDITMYVDAEGGTGCTLFSSEWRITTLFVDPVAAAWSGALWSALRASNIQYVNDGATAAEFVVNGAQLRASMHGGITPVCRLSTVIAREVLCSADLLAELNTVNAKFAGINLWWENDMIVAVTDIDMSHIGDISAKAERLVEVTKSLGLLLASL